MKVIKIPVVLKALKDDGWFLVHQVGSHRQFKHLTKKGKHQSMVSHLAMQLGFY